MTDWCQPLMLFTGRASYYLARRIRESLRIYPGLGDV